MVPRSRREFLSNVGKGMLLMSVGSGVATDLGLASTAAADDVPERLTFGGVEPLVSLMQETPADRLLPILVDRLNSGTELRQLVGAAVLANARSFGGEDYIGFHTMMAMSPAYHMARELPADRQALPVLKVIYRNTSRIQATGGRTHEVLRPVSATTGPQGRPTPEAIREAVRRKDKGTAEGILASAVRVSPNEAFNDLLIAVQDAAEVHRVVLPYRAWDLLDIVGKEHAHTMLRQSIRYCVNAESSRAQYASDIEALLPKLLEQYHLLEREPGTKAGDDAWVEQMSQTIFKSSQTEAAEAVASALADGFSPAVVGEALSVAANQLVLRDTGRRPQEEADGKPVGSVHGDSIGVHACDSANAWRNMARAANARNTFACLILGAYQVARDRAYRGTEFFNYQPVPISYHLAQVKATTPEGLLKEAEEAIRGNLQARAAAIIQRYGDLGFPARGAFDLLLRYACSEDGALHAEKYYRTASDEFASTRPAFRWRQVVALARVTASEYGHPAPGYAEACKLLKV